MRNAFRVYKSFEEFEREELRKLDVTSSFDDMFDEMFAEELDFGDGAGKKKKRAAADED